MPGIAPGSLVVVRDEDWLVRATSETLSGTRLDVTGVSAFVRDQDATFFTALEPAGSVQVLDPRETVLVADDTPGYRRSRLWLESLIKRTPVPVTETRIAVGHRALLDRMDYQLRPAELALKNLRPRILIGDAVGLGKTLEIGILLQELARRGRAERVLVVTPRAVLEQFQHEMWTRFAFPLVRLDSDGIQRVQRTLPASRNPFSFYKRVICSIDTLKNPARYKHHLTKHRWDVVVIDECHALINRATLNNQLAELLARQTDALILASATPHNGKAESFAELVRLLDPAAIIDPSHYTADDIRHLYVRRHRNSPDVAVDVADRWKARAVPRVVGVRPSLAEDEVLRELTHNWLRPEGGTAPTSGEGRTLFPWTLFKAFLSSPVALRSTIARRLDNLSRAVAADDVHRESEALRRLDLLAVDAERAVPAKLSCLLDHLGTIGVTRDSDTRVVVFSERIDTLFWLRDQLTSKLKLRDNQIGVLHAQVPDRELQQLVEDFALESSPLRILLASDIASEGLNLHRQCHQLVHYDLPWSFIRIQQRNGRIDRYLQLHESQVTALALASKDSDVFSDVRVVTRLLEKEHAANLALGDAGVLLDLHDEELEEQTVAKHLQQGEDIDDFVPEPDPAQLNPFAALMAAGGEHQTEAPPEVIPRRSLFDDDDNLLVEALDELIVGDAARVRAFDVHRAADDDLVAFNTPVDLAERLSDLPADYLRERRVLERIRITGSQRYAAERLAEARRSDHSTWPDVHFLGPLHPVLEWVTDRALARLGRNEAPVLAGRVDAPVFLTQGTWSNKLGQPVVTHWGAVHGLPHRAEVTDLVETLEAAGVREGGVNPGGLERRLVDLQPLVPAAIDAATADIRRRGRQVEDDLVERLLRERAKVRRWHDAALFVVAEAGPSARSRARRREIETDTDELNRLIDGLATTGDPFVRVVGVVVPVGG